MTDHDFGVDAVWQQVVLLQRKDGLHLNEGAGGKQVVRKECAHCNRARYGSNALRRRHVTFQPYMPDVYQH